MSEGSEGTTATDEAGDEASPEEAVAEKMHPVKFYHGQVFFDENGRILEEVGEYNNIDSSKRKVEICANSLKGHWAFALVRTMTKMHPHSREEWANAILYPDGTHRKVTGQDSADAAASAHEGKWLTIEQMSTAHNQIRLVPQTIMPYGGDTVYLQRVKFDDLAALSDHLKDVKTEVLFCQTTELDPVEAGLYAYMAITAETPAG
jgi:hypothetical protein